MEKRRIQRMPIVTLVALLTLFLSTGIAAADPPLPPLPLGTSCVLVTSTGVRTAYTVMAAPGPGGSFPIPITGGGWMWRYQFSPELKGTGSQFGALVPVCPDVDDSVNGINYTGNSYFPMNCDTSIPPICGRAPLGNMKIFPPASGYTSSNWGGWGIWDGNDNVVEMTNIGSTFIAIGTDNTAPIPLRRTSMQFKKGNDLLYCANIAGPGCYTRQAPPPPPQFAQYTVNSYREVTTSSGARVCIVTDSVTECDYPVYCRDSLPCPGDLNVSNAVCRPEGKNPLDEMAYTLISDIQISLTPGHTASSLQNIALPGANRCSIIVLNDADPTGTTCSVNPVTKRTYCY